MVEQHGTDDWTLIASHLQVSELLFYISNIDDIDHWIKFVVFQRCVFVTLDLGFCSKKHLCCSDLSVVAKGQKVWFSNN